MLTSESQSLSTDLTNEPLTRSRLSTRSLQKHEQTSPLPCQDDYHRTASTWGNSTWPHPRQFTVEGSSEGVAEGTVADSPSAGRDEEEELAKPQGAGSAAVKYGRCGGEVGQEGCAFLASARQCKTHGTRCTDCHELIDHCVCPGLPTQPRPHLTIDSAIVLAAFDQANEVTCRFRHAYAQDSEEAIEVSPDDTVLEGSDAGGHDARGEEEAGRRAASPICR